MVKYKETFVNSSNKKMKKRAVKEVPSEKVLDTRKGLSRMQIEEEVFDLADSVADNAKMISLLMSMVKRLYEVLPDDIKNNIQDNAMIESVIDEFDNTQTAADVKFAVEGDNLIKTIFERQAKIGEIIKNNYNL